MAFGETSSPCPRCRLPFCFASCLIKGEGWLPSPALAGAGEGRGRLTPVTPENPIFRFQKTSIINFSQLFQGISSLENYFISQIDIWCQGNARGAFHNQFSVQTLRERFTRALLFCAWRTVRKWRVWGREWFTIALVGTRSNSTVNGRGCYTHDKRCRF